jgi:WD40 repeat protein
MAAVGTAKEKTVRRKLHLRALGMLQKGWPLNSTYDPTVTRRLIGHSDGIWDVVCKPWHGGTIVGTASADQTARIWYDGACVCIYQGHAGSVNAISAGSQSSHGMPLMCTGSGDGTARLWRLPDGCLPHQTEEDVFHDALPPSGYSGGGQSGPIEPEVPIVRDDLQLFRGHTGVVSAIECFGQGRDKVVTGSWDRTGRVWDLESGSLFQVLKGHDAELTHVSSHPSKPLILTSSRDASFRIWDIRHTSNELVFQGHGDSVTSALFTDANGIVSSSDDRTVKFWDMRNMHSPTIVIRQNAGANRMAISPNGNTVAVPLDNRYVQLYRLTGHRMCRFARNEGHQKMVSAVAWADDQQLISSSFDSQALEWRIIDP